MNQIFKDNQAPLGSNQQIFIGVRLLAILPNTYFLLVIGANI